MSEVVEDNSFPIRKLLIRKNKEPGVVQRIGAQDGQNPGSSVGLSLGKEE